MALSAAFPQALPVYFFACQSAARVLAHQQGALLQQARLASGLGVSSPALARHIDLLVDLQMVRRLKPWSGNVGKRLVASESLSSPFAGLARMPSPKSSSPAWPGRSALRAWTPGPGSDCGAGSGRSGR